VGFVAFLQLLARRWVWWAIPLVLGTGAGLAYSLAVPPGYRSTEQLFVGTVPTDRATATDLLAGSSYTLDRMPSYAALMYSPEVLDAVGRKMGAATTAAVLTEQVVVTVPVKELILEVSATDATVPGAQRLAAAAAEALSQAIEHRETPPGATRSLVAVSIARAATSSVAADSSDRLMIVLAGPVVGMAVGILLAVMRDQALEARRRRVWRGSQAASAATASRVVA
jgi:polysaccharide biosynthesis transport protein